MYRLTPLFMTLLMIITVLGFWPSFFSRLAEAKFTHLLHGFTSTLWIIILGTQAWLINSHKPALHRTLGIAGITMAPLMIAGFALINLDSAHRVAEGSSMFSQLFAAPLLILDLTFLPLTLGFIYLGLKQRQCIRHHAACMVLTCFALIGPALSRLLVNYVPGFQITSQETISKFGLSLWFSLLLTILVLAVIAFKTTMEKKVWLTALGIYTVAFILYLTFGKTQLWREMAVALSTLSYPMVFGVVLFTSGLTLWVGWRQGQSQLSPSDIDTALNQRVEQ